MADPFFLSDPAARKRKRTKKVNFAFNQSSILRFFNSIRQFAGE
jgi:hypothetical protein